MLFEEFSHITLEGLDIVNIKWLHFAGFTPWNVQASTASHLMFVELYVRLNEDADVRWFVCTSAWRSIANYILKSSIHCFSLPT